MAVIPEKRGLFGVSEPDSLYRRKKDLEGDSLYRRNVCLLVA